MEQLKMFTDEETIPDTIRKAIGGRTIVSCRAILYDDLGELAEYNPSTGKFCTMMASGNTLMPYKLI